MGDRALERSAEQIMYVGPGTLLRSLDCEAMGHWGGSFMGYGGQTNGLPKMPCPNPQNLCVCDLTRQEGLQIWLS